MHFFLLVELYIHWIKEDIWKKYYQPYQLLKVSHRKGEDMLFSIDV